MLSDPLLSFIKYSRCGSSPRAAVRLLVVLPLLCAMQSCTGNSFNSNVANVAKSGHVTSQELTSGIVYKSSFVLDAKKGAPREKYYRATLALMHAEDIFSDDQGAKASEAVSAAKKFHICTDEESLPTGRIGSYVRSVIEDISIASCSGVLIGPDMVLTAKHCVPTAQECAQTRVLTQFRRENLKIRDGLLNWESRDFVSCRRLAYVSPTLDFVIFQLSEPLRDREPLKLPARGTPLPNRVWSTGYPIGVSEKITAGRVLAEQGEFAKAQMDTFAGSSGSGIFNPLNNDLVGLMLAGDPDFIENFSAQNDSSLWRCQKVKICEKECHGETFLRISAIQSELEKIRDPQNSDAHIVQEDGSLNMKNLNLSNSVRLEDE
jgi:hypothetical protein